MYKAIYAGDAHIVLDLEAVAAHLVQARERGKGFRAVHETISAGQKRTSRELTPEEAAEIVGLAAAEVRT